MSITYYFTMATGAIATERAIILSNPKATVISYFVPYMYRDVIN